MLKCTVDHILQEFYTLFLTRFRTYKIASPPQTKMTSKDDIRGLVSLKFLRLCPPPITALSYLPRNFLLAVLRVWSVLQGEGGGGMEPDEHESKESGRDSSIFLNIS